MGSDYPELEIKITAINTVLDSMLVRMAIPYISIIEVEIQKQIKYKNKPEITSFCY